MVDTKIKGNNKFGALILAAGRSSRMGEFKPLLEIDGKSLVGHTLDLFRNTSVKEIVTVIGYRSEDLIPIIERAASRYVVNENRPPRGWTLTGRIRFNMCSFHAMGIVQYES